MLTYKNYSLTLNFSLFFFYEWTIAFQYVAARIEVSRHLATFRFFSDTNHHMVMTNCWLTWCDSSSLSERRWRKKVSVNSVSDVLLEPEEVRDATKHVTLLFFFFYKFNLPRWCVNSLVLQFLMVSLAKI